MSRRILSMCPALRALSRVDFFRRPRYDSAMRQTVISAVAAAMGRKGARNKWRNMTDEQRADERKRAWRTRRKRKRAKRLKDS